MISFLTKEYTKMGKRITGYYKDYVVFDLETTGISSVTDRIIEISAVKVKDGQVVEEFSTLVNPERKIPKAASNVNHITDEMVKEKPILRELLPDFLEFIREEILVGHNIHSFDIKFIKNACFEYGYEDLKNDYVDTLYMARKALPQLSHHRLADLSEYYGIDTQGAHRALADCYMNQKVYEELGKIQVTEEKETQEKQVSCPLCGNEMVKRKGKYGVFYGCSQYPRCRGTQKA